MHSRKTLAVTALAVVPSLATDPSINVYWGQQGDGDLATVCQSESFEYITLGFINVSPENDDGTNYPGSNFGAHCWASWYSNNGKQSQLLSECPTIKAGIKPCQEAGKKILLSVGGTYSSSNDYTVSSRANGVSFANFLWGAFGPYSIRWGDQPRPFDDATNGIHNVVDGYDFDLETADAGDEGYEAMITTLRALIASSGRSDIITGAPQCPLTLGDSSTPPMMNLIKNVQFDRLWVQFYNNPQCEILDSNGNLNSGFNYEAWETFLAGTPSKDAKIHIGIPGSSGGAGSGYVNASVASDIMCHYKDSSMFGGIMLWDQYLSEKNVNEAGKSYYDVLADASKCGCGKTCPTTTSSTVSSTLTSSTRSPTSVVVSTTSPSSPSTSEFHTSTGRTVTRSHTSNSGSNSTWTTRASSSSIQYVTSTIYSTSIHTFTSCPPTVTSCPEGSHTSTVSIPISTTVVPVTTPSSSSSEILTPTEIPSETSSPFLESSSIVNTASETSSSIKLVTSTIYATRVHTFTSCAPTVTNCPAGSHISTESIPIFTTVIPMSKSSQTPSTTKPTEAMSSTSAEEDVTSTMYTTTVRTITSCAPTVTNCPVGSATTQTIPVSISVVSPTFKFTEKTPSSITTSASWTTSTIFSTSTYAITSCPPSVPSCTAAGSVRTVIVAVSTTVCPVAEAESTGSASVTPTPAGGLSGSSPSEGPSPWEGECTSEAEPTGSTGFSNPSESGSGSSSSSGPTSPSEYGSGSGSSPGSGFSGSSSPSQSGTGSSPTSRASLGSSASVCAGCESCPEETAYTQTQALSTVTVPVRPLPTVGTGQVVPVNADNGTRPLGTGYSHYTQAPSSTKTGSSPKPTSSTKSTETSSPIVTAGSRRIVATVGFAAMVAVLALVM